MFAAHPGAGTGSGSGSGWDHLSESSSPAVYRSAGSMVPRTVATSVAPISDAELTDELMGEPMKAAPAAFDSTPKYAIMEIPKRAPAPVSKSRPVSPSSGLVLGCNIDDKLCPAAVAAEHSHNHCKFESGSPPLVVMQELASALADIANVRVCRSGDVFLHRLEATLKPTTPVLSSVRQLHFRVGVYKQPTGSLVTFHRTKGSESDFVELFYTVRDNRLRHIDSNPTNRFGGKVEVQMPLASGFSWRQPSKRSKAAAGPPADLPSGDEMVSHVLQMVITQKIDLVRRSQGLLWLAQLSASKAGRASLVSTQGETMCGAQALAHSVAEDTLKDVHFGALSALRNLLNDPTTKAQVQPIVSATLAKHLSGICAGSTTSPSDIVELAQAVLVGVR